MKGFIDRLKPVDIITKIIVISEGDTNLAAFVFSAEMQLIFRDVINF